MDGTLSNCLLMTLKLIRSSPWLYLRACLDDISHKKIAYPYLALMMLILASLTPLSDAAGTLSSSTSESATKFESFVRNVQEEGYTPAVMQAASGVLQTIVEKETHAPAQSARIAEAWLLQLSKRGQAVCAAGYNALACTFAEAGSTRSAEYWLERTLEAGLVPEARTFVKVVHALCREGKISRAHRWAEQAAQSSSVGLELFKRLMDVGLQMGTEEAEMDSSPPVLPVESSPSEAAWRNVFERRAKTLTVADKKWKRMVMLYGLPLLAWSLVMKIPISRVIKDRLSKNKHIPMPKDFHGKADLVDVNEAPLPWDDNNREIGNYPGPAMLGGSFVKDLNFVDF
mmetsp:Transcript_26895/g.37282  ORF Transcript_26895/g.37282 Transcript_26895/m.37282 type:complete len:343 (+) Transcript_26895:2-1030(+)